MATVGDYSEGLYCQTQYISDFKNNGDYKDNSNDNDVDRDDEETQSDATDLNDDICMASSWHCCLRKSF